MANHERDPVKEQFWRRTLKQWQGSGLSIRSFCLRESLSEASFYQWRRELARRDQAARRSRPRRRFVPVRIVHENGPARSDHPIEILLSSGHIIRLGPAFEREALAAVVDVLESKRC